MYIYYIYIGVNMARAIMISDHVYEELTELKNQEKAIVK